MKSVCSRAVLSLFWPALILLLGHPIAEARAQGPDTVQRTIRNRLTGDHTYTCLVIDGGVVPLVSPNSHAQVRGGSGVTITWSTDDAIATIRGASGAEAALIELMGKKEGPDAWKKYMASTLHGPGYKYTVHDLQPDILDVNHWRIGAITMDYTLAGRASSSLLMIWRCKDGSTLAVTLQAGRENFQAHSQEIFAMIGASLLIPQEPER
jgi:hypothetical protein